MYLGLCLISVIVVVWMATTIPSRPQAEAVRLRDLERRDAQLRSCPDRVTRADVERMLRSYALAELTISHVLGTAAERGIRASTMRSWRVKRLNRRRGLGAASAAGEVAMSGWCA